MCNAVYEKKKTVVINSALLFKLICCKRNTLRSRHARDEHVLMSNIVLAA